MPLKAVVFSKTLIVRQPIAQSLVALDFQVMECSELSEAMLGLDSSPSLVVMDADGMAHEWRALAAGLFALSRPPSLVLLATRFNFNDAHEAVALKVAAVIVKPFRKEEHTPRLLDLALRQMKLRARRASPRFTVPENTVAILKTGDPGKEESFAVRNFGEKGAKVSAETNEALSTLTPRAFLPIATFSVGAMEVEVSADVVHQGDGAAGILFSRFFDSPQKLLRVLEERAARALGGKVRKRRW